MTDNGQPKKPSASEEASVYIKDESVRVLEMIYEQQSLEIIRCPSCQYPHIITDLIKNELGMVHCDGCDKSFYIRSDNSSSLLPEINIKPPAIDIKSLGIREYGSIDYTFLDLPNEQWPGQFINGYQNGPIQIPSGLIQIPIITSINVPVGEEFLAYDYPIVSGLIIEPRPENAIIDEDTEDEE